MTFRLGTLEVVTDLRQVDPATGILKTWKPEPKPANPGKAVKEAAKTPLVDVSFSTGFEGNVFAAEEPRATLQIRNWKSEAIGGKVTYQVLDDLGKVVEKLGLNMAVDSIASYVLPLGVEKFGRYKPQGITFAHRRHATPSGHCLRQVAAIELTEEQKIASPYGLNVHSGEKTVIEPFRKAGIVWFREYAFQWDWVMRAKGLDRRYAGWPYKMSGSGRTKRGRGKWRA